MKVNYLLFSMIIKNKRYCGLEKEWIVLFFCSGFVYLGKENKKLFKDI